MLLLLSKGSVKVGGRDRTIPTNRWAQVLAYELTRVVHGDFDLAIFWQQMFSTIKSIIITIHFN